MKEDKQKTENGGWFYSSFILHPSSFFIRAAEAGKPILRRRSAAGGGKGPDPRARESDAPRALNPRRQRRGVERAARERRCRHERRDVCTGVVGDGSRDRC